MADPDPIIRWTPKRKAAIVAEFLLGLTMPADIEAKCGVSQEELEAWCRDFQRWEARLVEGVESAASTNH